MTGDLTGKHHKDSKKSTSEIGYAYAGSGYGGVRTGSEKGFTLRSKYRIIILQMSRLMGKPTICIGENKDADQLRGHREADQRLGFRYLESTIPLLLKSEISRF